MNKKLLTITISSVFILSLLVFFVMAGWKVFVGGDVDSDDSGNVIIINDEQVITDEVPLYFTINIHIEPGDGSYCNNKEFYDNGKIILENLMDSAESIGAKLSVFAEYPFFYGAANFEGEGNNIIIELIERGHSIGVHSHYSTGGIFTSDRANLCSDQIYPLVSEENYVEHFEYVISRVIGKEDISGDIKSIYGGYGKSIEEFKSIGIKATYVEPCSFPEADNPLYCYTLGYLGNREECPSLATPHSNVDLLMIPTTIPSGYLSTQYARARIESSCIKSATEKPICGNWYQEDFDLVYSAVNHAVQTNKNKAEINTIGMTFHLHNFDDESKSYCGYADMSPDYEELNMFRDWLQSDIKPLSDSGSLKFANSNELIEMAGN